MVFLPFLGLLWICRTIQSVELVLYNWYNHKRKHPMLKRGSQLQLNILLKITHLQQTN